MKYKISILQFLGFITVSFLGTILHFLYDWTNSSFVALFSSVNESTWEHMKLLFFPMFAVAIMQFFYIEKDKKNFWNIKLKGTILGLTLIPVLFYTLNGVFGQTPDWVNISIFFISAALALIYETRLLNKKTTKHSSQNLAFIALCLIAVTFWVFTFMPPQIPLFQDPISGLYGIWEWWVWNTLAYRI